MTEMLNDANIYIIYFFSSSDIEGHQVEGKEKKNLHGKEYSIHFLKNESVRIFFK